MTLCTSTVSSPPRTTSGHAHLPASVLMPESAVTMAEGRASGWVRGVRPTWEGAARAIELSAGTIEMRDDRSMLHVGRRIWPRATGDRDSACRGLRLRSAAAAPFVLCRGSGRASACSLVDQDSPEPVLPPDPGSHLVQRHSRRGTRPSSGRCAGASCPGDAQTVSASSPTLIP